MKKWFGLFATQFLGIFNDNLLKFLAIFAASNWVEEKYKTTMLSAGTALLVIPFLFFSPWAGKLSKLKYKKKILVFLKLMEIPIMLVATIGFYLGYAGQQQVGIVLLFTSILFMGLQSCIYSPSKYGLIRDVDGEKGISFGTGSMEMFSFLGVLTGTIAASYLFEEYQQVEIFALSLLGVAVLGYMTSHLVRAKESKPLTSTEDTINPVRFIRENFEYATKNQKLNYVVLGLSFFWMVAVLLQLTVVIYVEDIYGGSKIQVGNAMAMAAIGIGLGCWVAGNASARTDYSLVLVGGLGTVLFTLIIYLVPLSLYGFYVCMFLAAMCTGIYKVPLNAYLQEKVKGRKLGDVIAYNNLITFIFLIAASVLFDAISSHFSIREIFLTCAIFAAFILVVLLKHLSVILQDSFGKAFYLTSFLLYRIRVEGYEKLRYKTSRLLVSNHISFLDSVILVRAVRRYFAFVIDKDFFRVPFLGWLFRQTDMIPISPLWRNKKMEQFYENCANTLDNGTNLCIFPEGQLTRNGNMQGFKKGVEQITKRTQSPIIPIYIDNAIGTHYTQLAGHRQAVKLNFNSKKTIHIKIGDELPASTSAFALRQQVKELQTDIYHNRFKQKDNLVASLKRQAPSLTFNHGSRQEITAKQLYKEAENLAMQLLPEITAHKIIALNTADSQLQQSLALALMMLQKPFIIVSNADEALCKKIHQGLQVEVQLGERTSTHFKTLAYGNKTAKRIEVQALSRKITLGTPIASFCKLHNGKLQTATLTHLNCLASVESVSQMFRFLPQDELLLNKELRSPADFIFNYVLPIRLGVNTSFEKSPQTSLCYSPEAAVEDKSYRYVFTNEQNSFKNNYEFASSYTNLPILSMNTPDFAGRSAAGQRVSQLGSKSGSYGRVVPGGSVKLCDEAGNELVENQVGRVWIRATGSPQSAWQVTSLKGCLDLEAYLFLEDE